MPELTAPTVELRESFLAAMDEFAAEGRGAPEDRSGIGSDLRSFGDRWHDPAVFREYVQDLLAESREETPRPEGIVPQTTLWYVDSSGYLGRLAIRHRLTPALRELGGHIGYDIRPSARRLGHATAMLAKALPMAHELGIDDVLITCDSDNIASEKVIRANGGIFEDQRGEKLRFWIRRGSARPSRP